MKLFLFLFALQNMKRPASQNKRVGVLRMAFRSRKVFGTFEKRAPGLISGNALFNRLSKHETIQHCKLELLRTSSLKEDDRNEFYVKID